jgi:hypothetical protein
MQKHPMPVRRWLFASLAAATVLLSACGGGGAGEEHDHENVSIDTAGRLAIAERQVRLQTGRAAPP